MRYLLAICFVLLALCPIALGQDLSFKTQDFPPYTFLVDGTLSGPAVEIVQATCQEANIEYDIELLPWTRAQDSVIHGISNSLFVIGKNKERESWLNFSYPLVEAEYGFFVQKHDMLEYMEPDDISGYHIGVYGPSNTATRLMTIVSKTENCTIDMRPDDEDGFRKLNFGRVNAVFSNKHAGNALIHKMNLQNIRYAGTDCTVLYYIGFSKEYVKRRLWTVSIPLI